MDGFLSLFFFWPDLTHKCLASSVSNNSWRCNQMLLVGQGWGRQLTVSIGYLLENDFCRDTGQRDDALLLLLLLFLCYETCCAIWQVRCCCIAVVVCLDATGDVAGSVIECDRRWWWITDGESRSMGMEGERGVHFWSFVSVKEKKRKEPEK